ncbi:MAG: hypothetical protein Q8L78_08685 [Coxiellaceae bacterium]|nr:hypothetical protein [Coxiellaceae bacterium]
MMSCSNSRADDAILYHCNDLPPVAVLFKDALNLATWRENFNPFACAIIHNHSGEIILVCDHLGIAPLYYYHCGKKIIFADNIPKILAQLSRTPRLLENQIHILFSEHKIYSDETLYEGIYRVEPGHLLHFKMNGSMIKKAFWKLNPYGSLLHYENDQDYIDHFSLLMKEAMVNAISNQTNIATEFSAGLDSSAVYCAAKNINIQPTLFMHVASPKTNAMDKYNDRFEKEFIAHYKLKNIHRIGAENFDPISVFNEYASWFAGPAPYLFTMFANPLHRAVEIGNHPILLSVFGGDQCVSGQVPLNFFLPELIHQGEYRRAWNELR